MAISQPSQIHSTAASKQPTWVRISIPLSSGFFMLALLIACFFDPSIRILHAFQALIYVAVIVLTLRNSPWGFGAGCFIGAFWNFLFLRGAAGDVGALLSGRAFRPDIALQFTAALAHFLLIAACIAGMLRAKADGKRWAAFIVSGLLTIGYLLLLIALLRPQFLVMVRRVFGLG